VSLSRRYAKAPAELGSLAVGTNGKCLPAWLMRHVLQDKMIAKVGGDARLAAYSTVCADKKDSLFEIICSPRKLSGPQGDKAARFGNDASVRVRFSFQPRSTIQKITPAVRRGGRPGGGRGHRRGRPEG